MLPEGWKRVPLHKIADVRTGLAKGKQGLKDALELPYLRVANVQDGHIDLKEVKTIQVGRADIDRYALRAGDVLMTEGGDFDKLGRGAVWGGEIAPCLHQNHVFAVRPDADYLDSSFLSALSASEYGRNYFLSCAKRSTNLASINSSQLKTFPVLLPRLGEQKGISEALSTWDAAIAITKKLLANSRRQKQVLMQQLLTGKIRLPSFSEPWRSRRISEVVTEVKRRVEWNDEYLYPLISVRRRSGGAFHRESLFGHQILTKKLNTVEKGDFLISKMQVVHGAMALLPSDLSNMYVSDSYIALRSLDETLFDIEYFAWLSATPRMYRAAYRSSYGVHIEKMTFDFSMFLDERFEFPPTLDEQKAISQFLGAAQNQIDIYEIQLKALSVEKRALMQQLLTGKRRIRFPATESASA